MYTHPARFNSLSLFAFWLNCGTPYPASRPSGMFYVIIQYRPANCNVFTLSGYSSDKNTIAAIPSAMPKSGGGLVSLQKPNGPSPTPTTQLSAENISEPRLNVPPLRRLINHATL